MGDTRNILLVVAIVLAIFIPYQLFIVEPMMAEQRAAQEVASEAETAEPGSETPGAFWRRRGPVRAGRVHRPQ